ncbi:MAG: hypothetical protein V9E83_01115 [Baekduia sp.]
MSSDTLKPVLWALAIVQGATGLAQAFAPGWFYDALANFGARSDHMLRDVATYYLASAVALAIAASRPSWRVPVLVLVLVQYVLHVINHLIDIANADPGWVGPADAISLFAVAVLLGWCLRLAAEERS